MKWLVEGLGSRRGTCIVLVLLVLLIHDLSVRWLVLRTVASGERVEGMYNYSELQYHTCTSWDPVVRYIPWLQLCHEARATIPNSSCASRVFAPLSTSSTPTQSQEMVTI